MDINSMVLLLTWPEVSAFLDRHKEGITLFVMAMIVSMSPTLPAPFNKLEALEWLYEWFHRGLLTLMSMRGAQTSVENTLTTAKKTSGQGEVTESSEISTKGTK